MRPFIHRFETEGHKYIYDVNSNQVLQVSGLVCDMIEEFEDRNYSELRNKFSHYARRAFKETHLEIRTAKKTRGLFHDQRPRRMSYWGNSDLGNLLMSSTPSSTAFECHGTLQSTLQILCVRWPVQGSSETQRLGHAVGDCATSR
jgi:hypothetical protein